MSQSKIGKFLKLLPYICRGIALCREEVPLALLVGKSSHGLSIHLGLVTDTLTCNILISLWTERDQNDCARHVFYPMTVKNSVTGYHDCWVLIVEMNASNEAFFSDAPEWIYLFSTLHVLQTYTFCKCKQLHAMALKLAMDSGGSVSTVAHDAYAKSNMIKDAWRICENMPQKSAVRWSSLLAGQVHNGLYRAEGEGVLLTNVILSAILGTRASLALIIEG
jgi:hypothetical protein